MTMHGLEHLDGARMGFLVSLIPMVWRILHLPSGMRKSESCIQFRQATAMTNYSPNESDFLKERLFGLSNPQGNHGESLKEAHFHIDNTPTVGYFF